MAADAKAKTATKKRITTPAKKKKAATAIDSPFRNFTPYKPKRNEEYMSEGQLAHLREMLVSWRARPDGGSRPNGESHAR